MEYGVPPGPPQVTVLAALRVTEVYYREAFCSDFTQTCTSDLRTIAECLNNSNAQSSHFITFEICISYDKRK